MKHSALIVATLAGLFSFGAMASTPAPAVSAAHSGITSTKAKADSHAKAVKHEAKVKSEKGKKAKKVKEEKQGAI